MKDQDIVQRFLFDGTDLRGEITTLTSSFRDIISIQRYPLPVCMLFGEFLAAASLIAASLKHQGIITVQASGDGPLSMIMAECNHNQQVRGIVRGDFDNTIFSRPNSCEKLSSLFGKGKLAITIEPDQGERYQGIVPMELDNLSRCLEFYFEQSAQLPTKIRLASNVNAASGILIQQLPSNTDDLSKDIHWQHFSTLFETIKSEEQLILSHNKQLYRLFHQDNVRLFEPQNISFLCGCSMKRTERALVSLGIDELLETCKEQGLVKITCQFCDQEYRFTKAMILLMFEPETKSLH